MRELRKVFMAVAVLVSITGHATSIDRQQAAQLARDFMSKKFSSSARRAAQTVPLNQVETGQSLVYAFNVEGGGFVVVAGDDCAPAILGFSETSTIDPADMPDGMKDLFAQYQEEMQLMMLNGQQAVTISTIGDEIKPLMKSKWGQGAPYNYMTPKTIDEDTNTLELSLTGCPATAMSQILYYHKYPAEIAEIPGEYYNRRRKTNIPKPDFTKTLEWDKMLPTYGTRTEIGGTQEQQDAVAKLLRLVGQSLVMEYSPASSAAFIESVYTSLVNFFKYDAATTQTVRRIDYSYADWVRLMYEEMKAERPVYYVGSSSSGSHAFVVHGYKEEDYFYINWGWYDKADDAFRLSLCNPKEKYEGGGTGSQGYAGNQVAVIGIQPATTPGHVDPMFTAYCHWRIRDVHTRASASEDFDLTKMINQWVYNCTHYAGSFAYGIVVRDDAGNKVKEMLPLNDNTKNLTLKPGFSKGMEQQPLKVGAGLGNGSYSVELLYRIGEGEWHPFFMSERCVFTIEDNFLTFDARPDWLTAEMIVTKLENADVPSYAVAVRLENLSPDQTYHSTLKLGRDNSNRSTEKKGFAVTLEPGEVKTLSLLYKPEKYIPKALYLVAIEDGSPICSAIIEEGGTKGNPDFFIEMNVNADLKQQADQSYMLKSDSDYEVVCNIKNNGNGDYTGYLELTDSIKYKNYDMDFDLDVSNGKLLTLKPGETKQLKMTIENDFNADIIHKVGLLVFSDDGTPISMGNTKEFTIRPVYDLRFTDFDVTPKEEVDDEYADYIVKGNKATVSGKILNTEATDFEGTVIIKRYTIDFNKEMEQDENGEYTFGCDKMFMTDVTIPANGSYDYSQEFDLQGLVSGTTHNVLMDFEITYFPKLSNDEVPLYLSSSYLLNDAEATGIVNIESSPLSIGRSDAVWYSLDGKKLSGQPTTKGIYIYQGKKYIK